MAGSLSCNFTVLMRSAASPFRLLPAFIRFLSKVRTEIQKRSGSASGPFSGGGSALALWPLLASIRRIADSLNNSRPDKKVYIRSETVMFVSERSQNPPVAMFRRLGYYVREVIGIGIGIGIVLAPGILLLEIQRNNKA